MIIKKEIVLDLFYKCRTIPKAKDRIAHVHILTGVEIETIEDILIEHERDNRT